MELDDETGALGGIGAAGRDEQKTLSSTTPKQLKELDKELAERPRRAASPRDASDGRVPAAQRRKANGGQRALVLRPGLAP